MPLLYDMQSGPVEIAPGRGDLRYSSAPVGAWDARRDSTLVGGKTVSYARLFAEQVMIGAAVMRMLTLGVRVPLKAYRRTGDDSRERLRPKDHPLARALVDPYDGGSQAGLTQSFLGPLLVHGNGLSEIDSGANDRLRFKPLDWRYSTPIYAYRDRIGGWSVEEDEGQKREVGVDGSIHLAWWSPLGALGVSPLQQLGTTVAVEDAAQRYQRGIFENSARPPSALVVSDKFLDLDPGKQQVVLQQIREDATAIYAGPENAGKPVVLPPGLDWKQLAHTAVEAELIDQRRVAAIEVCAVYQIPPPMLGILDKATFSNIEVQREMAYTFGLAPPLVLIEQAINAQLVRRVLREEDIFVEFDFAGVLRGDRLKEIQALREAIDAGIMTRNEGRAVLNMPRSDQEGMDGFYYAANNQALVGEPAGTTAGSEDVTVPEPAVD